MESNALSGWPESDSIGSRCSGKESAHVKRRDGETWNSIQLEKRTISPGFTSVFKI